MIASQHPASHAAHTLNCASRGRTVVSKRTRRSTARQSKLSQDRRLAIWMGAAAVAAMGASPATAQQSQSPSTLPPVVVETPAPSATPKAKAPPKRAASKKAAARRQRAARSQSAAPAAQPSQSQFPLPPAGTQSSSYQAATGPVGGVVATESTTGTKTGTPIMETPQSLSVVPREQIVQQAAESISDALHYTPGVIVEQRPASRYDIVNIRGLGSLQSFVHFMDGLKMQRGLNFDVPVMDAYLLERVEVMKGPASVLYGQVGVGGIVNLVSKKPLDQPFGEIAVQFGSHSRKQIGFDVGGPVDASGSVSYRIAGIAREVGTDIYGVEEERFAIAPSLTFRPTSSTTLTVLGTYLNDPESSYSVGVPALGTALPYASGKIPFYLNPGDPTYDAFKREQASIGYLFEHRFDSVWTVRQNLRYMSLDTDFQALQTAGLSGTNLIRRASHTVNNNDTFAVDTQAEARFRTGAVSHTMLLGVDYQSVDAAAQLGSSSTNYRLDFNNPVYGASIVLPPITTKNDGEATQKGLYAQDQIRIGNLIGVLGGRYDWATYDFTSRSASTGATTAAVSQEDEEFTWRGGLMYEIAPGIAPYFSYATSFEPITGTAVDWQGNPFKPTTGEQYEVGLKLQPTRKSLVTLSLFDIALQNVQTPDPTHSGGGYPCGTTCQTQTGEVRTRGLEIEGRANVSRNLDLIAGYTYLDTEVTKTNTAAELGKRPTAIPEHMAAMWAYYTFHEGSLRGFGLGGGVRYVGATYGNTINTWKVDDVTLVDAALSYDFGVLSHSMKGFQLQLNATNLFDREYLASCGAFGGGFAGNAATNSACYYGAGRNVLATLRYKW